MDLSQNYGSPKFPQQPSVILEKNEACDQHQILKSPEHSPAGKGQWTK